ncbi:MAG: deoxyribose-phosphate aldolase [bacterium]|nr:deoxyribose-phosphate aldolase [bacterium]
MKIAIGADHGGFDLKTKLAAHLKSQGHEVLDLGTSSHEAVDYPVYALAVAQAVADGRAQRGVMIDGAGIGSCMVANKVPGVRAAMAYDLSSARNGREHNDANLLTLGAGLIGAALAVQILDAFLTTDCKEPRHQRRVAMIDDVEKGRAPADGHPAAAADALSPEDLDRIVARLERLVGSTTGAACEGPCVASAPDRARRLVELGATRLGHGPGSPGEIPRDLARYIDHTILKPDATREQVLALCAEARKFLFRSICVNACWTKTVSNALRGTPVLTCTVVGFPLGATLPEIKAAEARRAIRDGAREIDMVINVGALKGGDDDFVLNDIRAVVEACRDGGAVCKVIIETALLTDDEKRRACEASRRARAHFVKTSTGFAKGGATAEDVALMASVVQGAGMEVKASGGIRSYADARRMIEAGATRIGASASVAIMEEAGVGAGGSSERARS